MTRTKDIKMAKKIYVGNLSYHSTEDSLRNAFAQFGDVVSANIVMDRYTGSSKGFGFVEMGSDQAASAAIAGMNGQELDGRQLRVNEANDKPRRENTGGGRW
jgi:RNA recognition motif-containing protein